MWRLNKETKIVASIPETSLNRVCNICLVRFKLSIPMGKEGSTSSEVHWSFQHLNKSDLVFKWETLVCQNETCENSKVLATADGLPSVLKHVFSLSF